MALNTNSESLQDKGASGAVSYEARWRQVFSSSGEGAPGSPESKARWDRKAPSFARKPTRSGYISQLIERLGLGAGESVFDMGCGSGTLAIPLALAGHDVIAVDFSDGMLGELQRAAQAEGVPLQRLYVCQRSWQQDWRDLPVADVAIASRSFVTEDLGEGVAKLESKARSRVAVTLRAGDLPYRDSQMLDARGKPVGSGALQELSCFVGHLFSIGRRPRIDYIEYPSRTCRSTEAALRDDIRGICKPAEDEAAALEAFLDEHIAFDSQSGMYCLDYDRIDRWALVCWPVG